MNNKTSWGVIGMGVMGTNLSRNFANQGIEIALYNRFVRGSEENIALKKSKKYPELNSALAFESLDLFVAALQGPRKILIMLPAGPVVDKIIKNSETHNCKIYYPLDVVVSKTLYGNGSIKEINEVNNDEIILDIGPKTIESIKNIINNTNTVLWNGPAGYFENPNFAHGTKKILEIIANKRLQGEIYAVAGGGETVAVINKFNKLDTFNFVSTAGGAFLEYLEGKELPGIKALN